MQIIIKILISTFLICSGFIQGMSQDRKVSVDSIVTRTLKGEFPIAFYRNEKEPYTGKVHIYSNDGILETSISFIGGYPIGEVINYFKSGRPQTITNQRKGGVTHGSFKHWHSEDVLAVEGEYFDDFRINEWKYYSEEGILIKANLFDDFGNLVLRDGIEIDVILDSILSSQEQLRLSLSLPEGSLRIISTITKQEIWVKINKLKKKGPIKISVYNNNGEIINSQSENFMEDQSCKLKRSKANILLSVQDYMNSTILLDGGCGLFEIK
ncbi:MAG: hypothetical protein JKY52_19475 [Flavobacteriales bacterium]|nr:hypothetical protein [Flavobacteriales bacterium]